MRPVETRRAEQRLSLRKVSELVNAWCPNNCQLHGFFMGWLNTDTLFLLCLLVFLVEEAGRSQEHNKVSSVIGLFLLFL